MQKINTNSIAELKEYINNKDVSKYPYFNISILRNITIEGIVPFLDFFTLEMGYKSNVKFGDYDNVLQDALIDNNNLLNQNTDCVMVFTRLETLSPKIVNSFTQLDLEGINQEKDLVKSFILSTLKGIRNKTNALISWHSFEIPINPAYGVIDHSNPNMQISVINELNVFLKTQLRDFKNCYFIDINISRTIVGYTNFYDNRYWHIGKSPFTLEGLKEIANENFKLFRALKGKNKKCLILDCDNTLWGGILGEDGVNGIKLGPNYPGSAFMEFQQEILNLQQRGIIIGLCSKNNESDVWNVIENHPHMLLKKEHISIAMINWDDKATNIKKIANTLNIGLDSIVFVDDNEFEINLVKEILNVVETIHLQKGKSVEYKNLLASSGFFDTLSITSEDKIRGQLYKSEIDRKLFQNKFDGDLESYYKTLNMKTIIKKANKDEISRIAQLTQKTNQFNLTTKRYTESDIEQMISANNSEVVYSILEDRFGNMGIVGCCIINFFDDFSEIDTFLLSCRVIGRGLEKILLNTCINLTKQKGISKIKGSYIESTKNIQVKDFYINNNFKILNIVNDFETNYLLDLSNYKFVNPIYYKEIIINI